jgi:hypothetical protein
MSLKPHSLAGPMVENAEDTGVGIETRVLPGPFHASRIVIEMELTSRMLIVIKS